MKFVIIGTGNICRTYIKAINSIEGAGIAGFISRSGNTPEGGETYPVWKSLEDVNAEYDTVIITTPNGLHHISAIQAAELKKHVLIEKPIDITLEASESIIEACKSNSVTLGISYQRRFNPDNLSIKRLIDENILGKIFAANLTCNFYRDQAYYDSAEYRGGWEIDGGGPFIQQAVHNIDYYQWLFGMPQEIKSFTGTFTHNIEAEDHGAAIFRHENGMIGSVIASTSAKPGFPARLEVFSDKGFFVTTDDRITQWEISGIPDPSTGRDNNQTHKRNLHEEVLKDFMDAVKNGRDPLISGESAKKTTDLVLRIYKDAKPK